MSERVKNHAKNSRGSKEGNSINYKYRVHDTRLGRFLSLDPLAPKYPHNSPYAFSENRVIDKIELEGLEATDPPIQKPPVEAEFEYFKEFTLDLLELLDPILQMIDEYTVNTETDYVRNTLQTYSNSNIETKTYTEASRTTTTKTHYSEIRYAPALFIDPNNGYLRAFSKTTTEDFTFNVDVKASVPVGYGMLLKGSYTFSSSFVTGNNTGETGLGVGNFGAYFQTNYMTNYSNKQNQLFFGLDIEGETPTMLTTSYGKRIQSGLLFNLSDTTTTNAK
jgi:hypothetical protein